MSTRAAIAPTPLSPQANVFVTGSITRTPQFRKIFKWVDVMGCSHIAVFIAGAINIGFLSTGQARTMQVDKLSQIPFAILANVFASKGAMIRMDAQFLGKYVSNYSHTR